MTEKGVELTPGLTHAQPRTAPLTPFKEIVGRSPSLYLPEGMYHIMPVAAYQPLHSAPRDLLLRAENDGDKPNTWG